MKKLYLLSVLFLMLMSCFTRVYAGWPIGKYRHIFTPSFTYYTSKNQWDKQGNTIKSPSGTNFSSASFGLFGGVGISRRADILASLSYSIQSSKYAGQSQTTPSGLGDATLGLSYNIAQFKYKRFISVQGTVIAPLYTIQSSGNTLGYGVMGLEGKGMFCGQLAGPSYFNAELGFRRYFDDKGPNQIVYTVTVGTPLDARKKNQISADISGVNSYSANKTIIPINPNLVYDGYYVKASLNFGHSITNKFSVFASGFVNVAGRNAPQGAGGALFAIFKF